MYASTRSASALPAGLRETPSARVSVLREKRQLPNGAISANRSRWKVGHCHRCVRHGWRLDGGRSQSRGCRPPGAGPRAIAMGQPDCELTSLRFERYALSHRNRQYNANCLAVTVGVRASGRRALDCHARRAQSRGGRDVNGRTHERFRSKGKR
jgi:hypothetical protein